MKLKLLIPVLFFFATLSSCMTSFQFNTVMTKQVGKNVAQVSATALGTNGYLSSYRVKIKNTCNNPIYLNYNKSWIISDGKYNNLIPATEYNSTIPLKLFPFEETEIVLHKSEYYEDVEDDTFIQEQTLLLCLEDEDEETLLYFELPF